MSDNFAVFTRQNGADMEFVEKATGDITFALRAGGVVDMSGAEGGVTLPNGVALVNGFGLNQLLVAHVKYNFAVDGGTVGAIIPAVNSTIPAHAIMIAATINPTTAITQASGGTIAIGTTAGSAANSILTATGEASFTGDALINGTVTFAAPVKMSAAGSVNLTVATHAITAGVIEIFVYYVVAVAA